MTAKQYLRQLSRIENQIKTLSEEIEERRTRLTSTAAPVLGDKVQTSPTDVFTNMMAALADKEVQQAELVYIYEAQRDKIVGEIIGLSNPTYSRILYLRYVRHWKWADIAEDMFYSVQRIYQLHGHALIAFAEAYDL